MVFEELITAAPELSEPIASLTFFVKILGGIAGVWLILWIISFILNLRRAVLLKQMLAKLEEQNTKLDKILKNK